MSDLWEYEVEDDLSEGNIKFVNDPQIDQSMVVYSENTIFALYHSLILG